MCQKCSFGLLRRSPLKKRLNNNVYKYDLPRQIKSVLLLLLEWYVILCENYGGIAQPNSLDNMFVDHPRVINHVTISVSELEYFWCRNYENFTLCPGSTVDLTSSPKQCLKSLEFSKQPSDVFTQIQ